MHDSADTLFRLIDGGDYQAVPDALAAMTADERRAAVPGLRAARAALGEVGADARSHDHDRRVAVQLAGAGCLDTVDAVADWLLTGNTRVPSIRIWRVWRPDEPLLRCLFADGPDSRDTAFQTELVRRIAEAPADSGDQPYYRLVTELVRRSGCPVPTTELFVRTWARETAKRRRRAALAVDPFLPTLLDRLFALDWEPEVMLGDEYDTWPAALASLAADGTLDADRLHRLVLASLVRGSRVAHVMRFRLETLRCLAPPPEACVRYEDDYVRLLVGGPATVVVHAQEVLDELLPPARVVELSPRVLLRPGEKAFRAQLAWLARSVREAPGVRGAALAALTRVRDELEEGERRARVEELIARGVA
ncbi:hypothetical protein [Streptomyces sedi]|uniref:Uncharacterized protein n=1 Tax=Streptomyces sedi TaxID=555059 RepID=A0A5C4UWZ5_9ACTN|nr:hypothetical protein [Streptomyces sedi]TNM28224.1 hypothetical protein FH715_18905 [Streptomyces sedi]